MSKGATATGVDLPAAALAAVSCVPVRTVEKTHPTRTCVGCRKRESKANLVRVVAIGDIAVPDQQARMPGRGAYVHLRAGCLEHLRRRRSLAQALRVRAELDLAALFELLDQGRTPPQHDNRPFGSSG